MNSPQYFRPAAQLLAAGAGFGAAAYLAYVGFTWFRYGRAAHPDARGEADLLLDQFIPAYEVAERHEIRVAAPAAITLSALYALDFRQSAIIRIIFKTRELILRSQTNDSNFSQPLISQMKALGWGVLAEIPGHEIVMGAVTKPWMAEVIFRSLPTDEFAGFHQPDYVKIAWTLRADSTAPAGSIASTETRAMTTDQAARTKFRWYWSFFSPGILLIRLLCLRLAKKEAESHARLEEQPHAVTESARTTEIG